MLELASLIRSCKQDFDDDAPRLVLADWLEEHGDVERATFIRLQCEPEHRVPYQRVADSGNIWFWRWSEQEHNANRQTDTNNDRAEQEILNRNRERWLGTGKLRFSQFHRGFFMVISQDNRDYLEQLSQLTNEQILWLDALCLCSDLASTFNLGELQDTGIHQQLTSLSIGTGDAGATRLGQQVNPVSRNEFRTLLGMEFAVLLRLSLVNYTATPDDIAALLETDGFSKLTDFSLTHGWAGRSLCKQLGERTQPCSLASLRVHDIGQRIEDAAIEQLCGATQLTQLCELSLEENLALTDRSLAMLAEAPFFEQLRHLCVPRRGEITEEAVDALRNHPRASRLKIHRRF